MANPILNVNLCNFYGNTGVGTCGYNPGLIVGAFAIPYGTVLSYPDSAIKTTLQSNLIADSRASRWFMFGQLGMFKDNTEDVKTENLDGINVNNFVPPYNWEYRLINKLSNFYGFQETLSFIESQGAYQWIFFDDQNQLLGTAATDANGLPAIGGVTLAQFFAKPWMQKEASGKGNIYRLQFNGIPAASLNQNFVGSAPVGFDILNTLLGLKDVKLTDVSPAAHAHGTNTVQGTVGSASLSDVYGSTLAAAGAWVVKNITQNTTVTPSAVALVNLANGSTAYQFTTSGQTNGDKLQISLAAPSVLAAAPYNIKYIVNETVNAAICTY